VTRAARATRRLARLAPLLLVGLAACGSDGCDGAVRVPAGWCATRFASGLGRVRHLAASPGGTLYATTFSGGHAAGRVWALRDTTGDGRADARDSLDAPTANGLALRGDTLWLAAWTEVLRWRIPPGRALPDGPPDTVVRGLPATEHEARTIAVGADGALYVNVGAPGNACERAYERRDFRGAEPCDELATNAGVWRFDARGRAQAQADGERFATGLRHTMAIALDGSGALHGVPHGIDHLQTWWPEAGYTDVEAAERPSETLLRLERGGDYGWPHCLHDPALGRWAPAPAYGGRKGGRSARCDALPPPLVAFPAHWAPMALAFHHGRGAPPAWLGAAIVAFHGSSWHRPLPDRGHLVALVRARDGRLGDTWDTLAAEGPRYRRGLRGAFRPSGVAVGADGAVYVADDNNGEIWRIAPRRERGGVR
jgi:glucose/arabinose dehydrogenase